MEVSSALRIAMTGRFVNSEPLLCGVVLRSDLGPHRQFDLPDLAGLDDSHDPRTPRGDLLGHVSAPLPGGVVDPGRAKGPLQAANNEAAG
jgi:hypothetical protein